MRILSTIVSSFVGTMLALLVFAGGAYVLFQAYQPEIVDYLTNHIADPVVAAIQQKIASYVP